MYDNLIQITNQDQNQNKTNTDSPSSTYFRNYRVETFITEDSQISPFKSNHYIDAIPPNKNTETNEVIRDELSSLPHNYKSSS
jgi:hypothetical protein